MTANPRRAARASEGARRPADFTPSPAPVAVSALASAAVGAAFAALYLVLAPPILGPRDSSELTLALFAAGPAHPTGYPLWILAGHAFGVLLHALGATWGYAANAWSAIGGGVAMGLLHALAVRLLSPAHGGVARLALALAAAAVIGLNPVWLLDAQFAEVYTWHLAWVCGFSLWALGWVRRLYATPPSRPTARSAFAAGLLAALGLTHHATAVLPLAAWGVALAVAMTRARAWRPALAMPALLGLVAGSLGLAFTAWRAFHPAAGQWPMLEPSASGVWEHVSGGAYRRLVGGFAPGGVDAQLIQAYVTPVLLLALAALALAVWRARGPGQRAAVAALFGAALLQAIFTRAYGVSDPTSYFEPALALGSLALPFLVAPLLPRRSAALVAGGLAVVIVASLGIVWLPAGRAFRTGVEIAERQIRALWRSVPAGPGFVFWRHVMSARLQAYQQLDGEGAELFVENPDELLWPGARAAFLRRHGFDPLEGVGEPTAATADELPARIAAQTPLPVYVFDLDARTVRRVAGPGGR